MSFPDEIERLEVLNFENNQINSLPKKTRGLRCLRKLSLTRDCLSVLPDQIEKLVVLSL